MASPKRERALTATLQSAPAKWKRRAAADRTDTVHLPTLGSGDHCWCGLPARHDWPGQSDGTPHPRAPKGQL
ncbi:hypothetical protein ACIQRE_01790 [Streptomyces griseoluteus]|uniref:hypothetical protein n=1 Tax=Streptomyces griseoluteus TaxID=29306 RepID=UPI00381553ED